MHRTYLRDLASRDRAKVIRGLSQLIQRQDFNLSAATVQRLRCWQDPCVAGWLFAYTVYAAPQRQRYRLLYKNLTNPNPRIREQACDVIGDAHLKALRPSLRQRCYDRVGYVAEAARYNHDHMF